MYCCAAQRPENIPDGHIPESKINLTLIYFDWRLAQNGTFEFQNAQAMRQHIRHPVSIPIEVKTNSQLKHDIHNTVNLGGGGLAFRCDRDLAQGEILEIRIPFVQPPFETKARVAWCKPHDKISEYGIEFLNQDETHVMRMVDQVCRIENYQRAVRRSEGRQLSAEEAAREWIGKQASEIPGK